MASAGSGVGETSRTCPSARCEHGSTLIGIAGASGVVGFIRPGLPVDEAFIDATRASERPPEQRFRFATECVEDRCLQWTGTRCSVIDTVLEEEAAGRVPHLGDGSLPHCGIRGTCRWYAQTGANACRVCPLIVADTRRW